MKRTAVILITLFAVSCKQQPNKSKWHYPDAIDNAKLYQGKADIYTEVLKHAQQRISDSSSLTPLDIDSAKHDIEAMRMLIKINTDSANYFFKIAAKGK